MDAFYAIICAALIPVLIVSFRSRKDPSATLGPTVCEKCGVELRGWNSSGKKQVWTNTDAGGSTRYFCARCKDQYHNG